MKRIYIAPWSKGWVILTKDHEKIAGLYRTPQQALDMARTFASQPDSEIIIYPGENFNDRKEQRRQQGIFKKSLQQR